jgi:tetratricopeptide (TPR) repeat protein
LAPDYQAARYDYVRVLLDRHSHARALDELQKLLSADPHNRSYRTALATTYVGLGETQRGIDLYRELLAESPAAELHLSIAHALKTLGLRQAAVDSYHAAAALKPDFGDAYWSLANLKTYQFAAAEVEHMAATEAAPGTSLVDRYHLCFALGKAYEDAARYAESFELYARGNALKKSETRYDPGHVESNARLQAAVCTRDFFAARRGAGSPDPAPIFIVGLPRSGSTLLEQILASHPQVEGTMELPEVLRLANTLRGRESQGGERRYPGVLAELDLAEFRRLGEQYLVDTRIYRTGKPFFIDKMPNNFRHIGLIHLMLPNAKIIDARREPIACCFGNFKQLFAAGQEFTYGIEDIARYYCSYVRLMAHWDAVLPGRVLRVRHEDVVEDLEVSVRRLLDHCGLKFEPACLEFYRNDRSVRTASSEQVRRPIYREGLDQWRHFEPWLDGLKAALGPACGA